MKTEIVSPIYKKAYLVRDWGNEIENGMAFNVTIIEYGCEFVKSFFIKDGNKLPEMVSSKNVVYDLAYANILLKDAKEARKKYYQKQLEEAKKELEDIS